MKTEVLKEKREYTLDYSKNIQKMKFNILFLKNSQALKNNLLNFIMEYKD